MSKYVIRKRKIKSTKSRDEKISLELAIGTIGRLTTEDIVKCVLHPSVQLPEFRAKNLARLPPVDVSHCDVSAILLELHALRAEVRSKKGSDCSKS